MKLDNNTIDFIGTYHSAVEKFVALDNNIEKLLEEKESFVIQSIITDIYRYCDRHGKVYIQNFDDMKIVYFMGVILSDMQMDNKYLLFAIEILDRLVYVKTNQLINKRIQKKIINSIEKNNWRYVFGIDGIYTIYKVCHRQKDKD